MALEFRGSAAEHFATLVQLCRRVSEEGGRCLVVGGTVRDALLEFEAGEFDLEIFGLQPARLEQVLTAGGFRLDRVGEAFGVLKLRDHPFDIALPRRESKRGLGHRGFEVHSDPGMSLREAALRRDFTINAMSYDPLSEELIDPCGGAQDLERRRLRHVSERFADDPLRVLRGMQFVARFELAVAPETVELCRSIGLEGLAGERLFAEFEKLLLRGRRPSLGLRFLAAVDWLEHFPEIAALAGCPQDPQWHPEGDVLVHTGLVLDAFAAARLGDRWEDLVVGMACLCHDFGKPAATEVIEGRVRSPNHEALGEPPTRSFIARLSPQRDLVEAVVPLVREHLKPHQLHAAGASDSAVRRLARRVGRIDRLLRVVAADQRGRPPLAPDDAPSEWLRERAAALAVEQAAPAPLLRGRDLIRHGLEPGPHFKSILDAAYEAQLDGVFDAASAARWLERSLELGSDGPLGAALGAGEGASPR